MDRREYEVMAEVEDRHFWFVATRAIVRDAFIKLGLGKGAKVLDLGCGTGGTIRALKGLATFLGLDISPIAASFCKERSDSPVLCARATRIPLEDSCVDCVLALDVFEHIEEDSLVMAEVRRVLRPKGALIATVPCHPCLFSEHDVALRHVRRYTRRGFLELVRKGGLVPERVTWTNMTLFPLVALLRLMRRKVQETDGARSDASKGLGPFNFVGLTIMMAERQMLRYLNLPFGLSLLVVARRPNE